MRKRVVVTGASGHLGFHVARELCAEGHSVTLLVRRINANVAELARRGAQPSIVDFGKPSTYVSQFSNIDCVFHCAAENTTDQSQPDRVMASSIGLTRSILTAALEQQVQTIVYTSSVVVLGRSDDRNRLLAETDRTEAIESPYVRGKVEADEYCEQLINSQGADIRRLYPSWIMGSNDSRGTPPHKVINDYLRKGQRFYFDGGISITGVEAVAKGHVATWQKGGRAEAYVLGGQNVTFREFFEELSRLTGKAPPSVKLPKWFIVLAARLLKIGLGSRAPLDPAYAKAIIGRYSWYDSRKANQKLGYVVPPLRELLQKAVLGERKRLAQTYDLGKLRRLAQPATGSESEIPPLLITGVPGWLGNRFVDYFINGDLHGKVPPRRKIRLLVEARNAALLNLPDNFEIVSGDICDPEVVYNALQGIKVVFHLAGAIYPPRIETLYRVNSDGTRNLVDQCIARGVRRILFMGTDSICGHGTPEQRVFDEYTADRPYRHYGRSKWLAEKYILEKTAAGLIDGTSLRGFWFFGPFAPPRQQGFLNMMQSKRQLVFGNGKNFRSISHVDNTIAAFLAAENVKATYGKWYWIGDSKADYTVDEIYEHLCKGAGSEYRPIYIPAAVCVLMRGFDILMAKTGRLHGTIHGIGKFSFDIAGTIEAARRDFGYAPPVSFEQYAKGAFEHHS